MKKNINVSRNKNISLLLSDKEHEILEKITDGWSKNEIIRFLIHFYADIMGKITKDELFKDVNIEGLTDYDDTGKNSTVQMWVRFSKTEQNIIKKLASNIGMNTSDFIRYVLRYYILMKYIGENCIDVNKAIEEVFKDKNALEV